MPIELTPKGLRKAKTTKRWFDGPNGDRYKYDFRGCPWSAGWRTFDTDQDNWYFGIWVHPEEWAILSYVEGDVTFTQYPTEESYKQAYQELVGYHGPPPKAATVIDFDDKFVNVTKFYPNRPE